MPTKEDAEAFQTDLEKWNEGAAEWRCESWNDEEEEENEHVEEEDEEISQRIPLQSDGMTELTMDQMMAARDCDEMKAEEEEEEDDYEEIEVMQTRDQSTNTECVFVKTKPTREPGQTMSKGIVIKRSQTFSPSAVANRQEYICRVSRICFIYTEDLKIAFYVVFTTTFVDYTLYLFLLWGMFLAEQK